MKSNWLFVMVASVGMIAFAGTARASLLHGISVTDNGTTDTDLFVTSNASDGDTSTSWGTSTHTSDYFGSGGTPPVLTIDLGDVYRLTDAAFWNYGLSGNDVKSFSLTFSTDGTNYGTSTSLTAAVPPTPAHWGVIAEEDFALTTVAARYVKMTITANWQGGTCANSEAAVGGDRVGFRDIQFNGTVVPEPSALALLATCVLGLLAYAWRKRKS